MLKENIFRIFYMPEILLNNNNIKAKSKIFHQNKKMEALFL